MKHFLILFGVVMLISSGHGQSAEKIAGRDVVSYALSKAGISEPSWKTLIVSVSRETELSPEMLWKVWSDISKWNRWSQSLHDTSCWLSGKSWEKGATFMQTLHLGFPFGTTVSKETVGESVPGDFVAWWKNESGVSSCHIWKFERLPNERTRIYNVEVFHGFFLGLMKPVIGSRWEKSFLASVDGLIAYSEMQKQ